MNRKKFQMKKIGNIYMYIYAVDFNFYRIFTIIIRMLIFEDDIAVDPGAEEPTCSVIEGLNMGKHEGLAFLGR